VPLHRRKQASRGYNQSEWIAMGIAEAMGKPLSSGNLVRHKHTTTQTRKNRFERWKNVEGIFSIVKPHEFENIHILLVDDVVTTGSTLEACAAAILKCPGAKISIVTLAYADI
jgi:ComF family protein